MRLLILILYVFASAKGFSQGTPFQHKFRIIDRYIDSLMKEWNIPGLAMGIVYKDQYIYGKGYGYRHVEKKLPVETTTLFPIASNTKLFTTTLACMLDYEKQLILDKPVRFYLPLLNFNNDELNTKVTLRDMLSHRTGLPRYDGIWIASPMNRKDIVHSVSTMKPQLGFREGYIYNNVMFAAAGAVIEKVVDTTWEVYTKKRIFQPLEMTSSCFSNEEMWLHNNYSLSYLQPDSTGKLVPRKFQAQSDALGPAGTIKSNVEDMSHWMIAQLNGGQYKGRQVIPAGVISQTMVPHSIADKTSRWEELSNPLYGLGRIMQMYKGRKMAMHTGAIDGFFSNLTLLPFDSLGIFIIYNSETAGILRSVIALPILDRLLGLSSTPWSERYRKDYLEFKVLQKRARDSINATQVKNTIPSHPLNNYTGLYHHPVYGEVHIALQQNQLQLLFRRQQSPLHHFHYDQFITKEENNDHPDFRLHFLTNSKGEIDRFSMQPYSDPVVEFVKKK